MVLQLSYEGKQGYEIAQILQISTGKVSGILHKISVEARKDIEERLFTSIVPLETRKRLAKLDRMDSILFDILEKSTDDRVRQQSIAQICTIDRQRMEILTSEELLSRAISAQKQTLLAKEADNIANELERNRAHVDTGNITSDTGSSDQDPTTDYTIQNESISVSSSKRKKQGNANNV